MKKNLGKENIEDVYPMTDIEMGMVYHSLKNPTAPVYHNQMVFNRRVESFDPEILRKAMILLVKKHSILRTGFNMYSTHEPVQIVYKKTRPDIEHYDISHLERTEQENYVQQKMVEDKQIPYDLMNSESLWRMKTFALGNENICFMWTCHHAILDGWSSASLVTELNNTYMKLESDPYFVPQKLKSTYKEFVTEQIIEKENNKTIDYWKKELEGYKRFEFPAAVGNSQELVEPVSKKIYETVLGESFLDKLNNAAVRYDTSLKHLCFGAYIYMLNMLSYEGDIVVGLVTNNRPACEDGEKILGCFLNTVPVRVKIPPHIKWSDYIRMVDKKLKRLAEYDRLPLFEIARGAGIEIQDQNPIFDTLFSFVDFHVYKGLNRQKVQNTGPKGFERELSITVEPSTNTLFDFNVDITSKCLGIAVYYSNLLASDETVKKCCRYFENILDKFIHDSDMLIEKNRLISLEEKKKLLYEFNDTAAGYPKDKTIHRLFAEQAGKSPGNTAVVFESHHLTYGELDKRADRLAAHLIGKGVLPDSIVGIMDRSLELIIGILGILKAGGAYLPIDPDYPRVRITFILEESGALFLLTRRKILDNYSFTKLWTFQREGVEVVVTSPRPQVRDFDGLPIPNRSLVNYDKYNQSIGLAMVKSSISLQATRGCPYNCKYCHKIWPKKHVVRSAENIFEEVRLYYNLGVRRFTFVDDIFNLNIENSQNFFCLIIEKGYDVQFFFPNGLRGDLLTKEYIDLMVKAGTVSVALALETASPRMQRLIGKNLKLGKFYENIDYFCKKHPQVILELFTMHGFPTETEEEALMTLDFIKSLKWLHFPYVHILKIFPNSDMAALALESGISQKAINDSINLAYHELPETLPFDQSFTLKYQTDFLNDYFLSKERLLHVLPYQMKRLTKDELLQKYNSYMSLDIRRFSDILEFVGISDNELREEGFLDDHAFSVPQLDKKLKKQFPVKKSSPEALKILLLDLSQSFSGESPQLYDVVEPPLGLMYLMTYLNREFGSRICGKIAKSRIDFDNYGELKGLLTEFKPQIIGIRTLSFHRDFFHKSVAAIRGWGIDVPIIAGGPYATSDYKTVLRDRNIDLVVLGEGEVTLSKVISSILGNGGRLPSQDVLKNIAGLAFLGKQQGEVKTFAPGIIALDELTATLPGESAENPIRTNQPEPGNLAYIIYTSGSTGKPKGVMVEHMNVVRLFFNDRFQFDFNEKDIWTMFHSPCFDFSVWEIYGALLYGGKLIIIPRITAKDQFEYYKILQKEGVTVLNQTPSVFYNLIREDLSNKAQNLEVRYVIFGGEALKPGQLKDWHLKYPDVKLINMYGITETTVHVTYKEISDYEIEHNISNIGKPIPTLSTYILDRNLQLNPLGVAGELCIGGAGVSRGYLGKPGLTSERFISNPYKPGEKLYKSGDLARILENGEMEYLGRIDKQVKIRGFRIELGEVEANILKIGGVQEVVVVDMEDDMGDKHLCAYVVSGEAQSGAGSKLAGKGKLKNITGIRKKVSGNLPDYMIPSYFVELEKIPLTPNGKIDRKALPEPEAAVEEDYVAPRGEVERRLCQVWGEVLGVKEVGIKENFFELGGDSIKAIQVAARLQKYQLKLFIADLFTYPRISELSSSVSKVKWQIDQEPVEGEIPLTPIQKWFFQQRYTNSHHFNQSVMLYSENGFSEDRVKQVFIKILQHHDVLRVVYKREGESVVQVNQAVTGNHFDMASYDLRDKPEITEVIRERAQQIQGSIDITRGPLVKLGLFKTSAGDHLLIVIHHLVVDGISWRIILEDFSGAYDRLTAGKIITFPSKTHSFKYWSQCLARYSQSRKLLGEIPYWRGIEEADVSLLPVDYEIDPSQKVFANEAAFTLVLDKENTKKLLSGSSRAYNTEINDLLLTALGLAVCQWSKSRNILVNLEGHGRENIEAEVVINRTVGWFTTQYPVLLEIKDPGDISYSIRYTKETLRGIPHRGIGYGILRYITPKEKLGGLVFKQEPEISFNYLGEFGSETTETLHYSMSNMPRGNPNSTDLETGFKININGMTAEGQLRLTFSYNKKEYEEKTIKDLSENYRKHLLEIIHHCAGSRKVVKTPSDYGCRQLSLEGMEKIEEHVRNRIDKDKGTEINEIYPLSPMQAGMLFHALMFPASSMYLEQNVIYLKGEIDAELLEWSFNSVIARYDILRTFFINEGLSEPLQVVLSHRPIKIDYRDISHLDASTRDLYIEDFKQEDKQNTFDLSVDHLFRVSLLRTSSNSACLIWSLHHILMDGWCLSLIYRDLLFVYNALNTGNEIKFTEVTPYRRYIDWLGGLDKEDSMTYWENYLYGYDEKSALPRLSINSKDLLYDQQRLTLNFSEEVTRELGRISAGIRVTINTMMQTIWGILIHKYNNSSDAVFGAVVSGRPAEIEGIEEMVGLFINTVPVRIKREEGDIFAELVKKVQQEVLESKKHEFFPLAEIQALTRQGRSLIDHIMVFENYPVNEELKNLGSKAAVGFTVEDMEIFEQTNYDFNITVLPGRSLFVEFTYNASLYARGIVERLATHFNHLVDWVLAEPGQKISEFEILSAEERSQLLDEFNLTAVDYPKDKTIHRLFEEQEERTPDNIAAAGVGAVTYRELNRRANQLARVLVGRSVMADTIAAVMVERSLEMIIAILGILKAGGAYLPIDPEYPDKRIAYMLTDSNVGVLVTTPNVQVKPLSQLPIQVIVIETELASVFEPPLSTSTCPVSPANLAYIIYTSGTTGKSKGVMIEHRNVVRLMFNDKYLFDFSRHDVWTMFHSYCFDFSVWEMYGALLYGGKLVLISKMTARDPHRYLETLKQEKVTILNQTPAAFYNLSHHELESWGKGEKLNLKYVIFGGEALNPVKLREWKEKYPETKLINMFGITETTVHVTCKELEDKDIHLNISNIGQPIPTLSTYVMDNNLKIVPLEAAGELCVGGEGVSRGYLNRPGLTAEKFVENPYISREKLYRSGDLVRLSGNSDLEYLGRIDHQVKIRGFRIELGEIEYRLLRHETVKEAVVTVRSKDKEDKYLCAYIVSDVGFTGSELRAFLSLELPDYMIPAYFVPLENIPLTVNGKVDRKALPEPETGIETDMYFPPRDDIEEKLVRIWSEILGIEETKISTDANFFQLGGHSLRATVMSAKIHKQLHAKLPLAQVFKSPTIRGLSSYIKELVPSKYLSLKPTEKREYYPLSSAQRRLYILKDIDEQGISYNLPSILILEGDVNKNRFEDTFGSLIKRHESLRTSFHMIADEPVQRIHEVNDVEFEIEYYDAITGGTGELEHLSAMIHRFFRPFDLFRVPLLRVGLIKEEEKKYLLMVDMHHIVSDGVSMGLLIKEFMLFYHGESLPHIKGHYKDFSEWQNSKELRESIKQQRKYWLREFEGEIPVLNLPFNFPRPVAQSFEGRVLNYEMDKETILELKAYALEEGTTLFMVLLTAYNILLQKLSNHEDILVGTPIAGRSHADLEHIVGMFVNTLVLRNFPEGEKSFKEFLGEVKARTLDAFENQYYPYEELVESAAIVRDTGRNPLFDTMFILQNMDTPEIEIPGLTLKPYDHDSGISRFDLTLQCYEIEEKLLCTFEYSTKLFKKATIERFIIYFIRIISFIIDNPQVKIADIEIISKEERTQLLFDFNDTRAHYPKEKNLQQLFEEQVESTPDYTALLGDGCMDIRMHEEVQITYCQLNEKSNQLAHLLRKKGVKPDTILGLMIERSVEMPIGIFGILKAGGAYLPIDPEYPQERINYMLTDSNVGVLVTTPKHQVKVKAVSLEYIDIETELASAFEPPLSTLTSTSTSTCPVSLANLAYIIYTSGSTGTPKGVIVENPSVINILTALQKEYPFKESDIYLLKTSYVFDVSVTELFGWFLGGGKCVILEKDGEKDPERILDKIQQTGVTHINFVPSMFNVFVDGLTPHNTGKLFSLRYIFLAGEALLPESVNKFKCLNTNVLLENIYGPTEGTVYSSKYSLTDWDDSGSIPIGRPMQNNKLYILDKYHHLQPIGIPGELCISGEGVARGYLNNPELTEKKFKRAFISHSSLVTGSSKSSPNDQWPMTNDRFYMTGDLARWRQEGNIEFLGRLDHQVKIRGFRIELEEIEHKLSDHKNIKEVVVLLKSRTPSQEQGHDSGERYICAYYVPKPADANKNSINTPELREYLSAKLPDFMIPRSFIQLEKIPLTPNGKIDRKSLLEFDDSHPKGGDTYILPGNDLEKTIAGAWKEILKSDHIGIYDNFFDLGGTSLDNIRVNNRLRQLLKKDIPIIEMYRNPTIDSFARYLSREGPEETLADFGKNISTKKDRIQQRRLKQRARKMERT